MRKIEVRIRYFLWAISRLKSPTTGDRVKHSTGEYFIRYGNPHWIFSASHHGKKQFTEDEFKIIRSWPRDIKVFKERYRFQMTSWYSIDCRSPLFSRISYINSSNIRFYSDLIKKS